jgi:hypothetical protein
VIPPPWDMDWVYGDAPPPLVDGHKIVVFQRGFIGVVIAIDGYWRDERNRAPWGAGVPRGWWAHWIPTLEAQT